MSKIAKTYIVGTGGFAREVAAIFDQLDSYDNFLGFIDQEDVAEAYKGKLIMDRKVLSQNDFTSDMGAVVVAIGDSTVREKVVSQLPENTKFTSVIDPNAIVSRWVSIGEGSVVCAGCILTTQIKLGAHAQLNLGTTIGHACVIGDFFTTAPSVNISGDCNFDKRVYFGTGAATRQGIDIVSDVTIGMGAMVVKNIIEPGVYVGIPAKKLSRG
jgi:sugar O-acyltransferase (sialic acid O-acetyltransferase NeuD family)